MAGFLGRDKGLESSQLRGGHDKAPRSRSTTPSQKQDNWTTRAGQWGVDVDSSAVNPEGPGLRAFAIAVVQAPLGPEGRVVVWRAHRGDDVDVRPADFDPSPNACVGDSSVAGESGHEWVASLGKQFPE